MRVDSANISHLGLSGLGSADDQIYRNDAIYMPIVCNDLRIQILDLRQVRHRKDWVTKSHRHPWYEFNFVSDGSVFTCIGGTEFLADTGSFFLVPPQMPHSHRHNNFQGDAGFCLRFLLEKVPAADPGVLPVADSLIRILSDCAPEPRYFPADRLPQTIEKNTELQFPGLFVGWLTDICACIAPEDGQERVDGHHAQQAGLVRQIELYLESFFSEDFAPEEFARSLNYSYRHLSRVYKQTTGRTITQRLADIRVQRAKELLADPDISIKEVSRMAGFSSYAAFFKAFEGVEGCTPSQFRNQGGST